MRPSPRLETPDIVIAATRWLIARHRVAPSRQLARMVEQHLDWIRARAARPELAEASRALAEDWQAEAASADPSGRIH